jgi:cell division protein FtsB
MDDIDYQALREIISTLTLQNKQLKRANINKSKENKQLKRTIKKLKDDAAKERKPHYRNGQKRGSNGRHG